MKDLSARQRRILDYNNRAYELNRESVPPIEVTDDEDPDTNRQTLESIKRKAAHE